METLNYQFFTVQELPLMLGRKTHKYEVRSRHGDLLAMILWYGPWRQFVLSPTARTVWSSGCLADVQDAIEKIEAERKRGE